VTGPFAVGSWKLPVAPGLKFDCVEFCVEPPPLPPHAARESNPTEDRATNGVLSLMYSCLSLTDRPDETLRGGARGHGVAVGEVMTPSSREPAVHRLRISSE
jgi:hypothetical protein